MLSFVFLIALSAVGAIDDTDETCSAPWTECTQTRCCHSKIHGCMFHKGKQFAMCRHMPTGKCEGPDGDWLCPYEMPSAPPPSPPPLPPTPPPMCASNYGNCFDKRCCTDSNFDCYIKTGKHYAQCRPKVEGCVTNDDWTCPGNWPPANPPTPPSPPPDPCGNRFEACTNSQCCRHHSDVCKKKVGVVFAMCRALEPDGRCVSDTSWTCVAPPYASGRNSAALAEHE